MTEYVAGFLFDTSLRLVLLIQKKRPAWMYGLNNAIGGHIEEGEEPLAAMIREFREETGVQVGKWNKFAVLSTRGGDIHWYWAVMGESYLHNARSITDEVVRVFTVENVLCSKPYLKCMPNLNWLIGMALNAAQGIDPCENFNIVEHVYRDIPKQEST